TFPVTRQGDEITYTVTVLNDGNVTLTDVTVDDPLCTPDFQSGDTGNDQILGVGELWTYTCTYAVTQDDVDSGAIVNTATVGAKDPHGDPIGGEDSATVAAEGKANLE